MKPRSYRSLLLLCALALLAGACGGSDENGEGAQVEAEVSVTTTTEATSTTVEPETETAGFPLTIDAFNGTLTIVDQPARIVSLSPSGTEILFAVGAGDQVIAVDSLSNYPPEAPITDLSAFEPNFEAISAYEPDLVITSFDPENALTEAFALLDVPVLIQPSALSLDDTYAQIAEIGLVTGQIDGAAEVNADVRSRVDAAIAQSAGSQGIRVYHELDDTFYSVSSSSFIGDVYSRLGFENIADPADPDRFGFPQLTPEAIIEANPQLIVITDQVGYTADDVASRPGWDQIDAVESGNIEQVGADISSRWGPRVADFVEQMADVGATVNAG